MNVTIPARLNLPKLLKEEKLTKTRYKNLRDKIYYFLSLLTRTNDNVLFLFDDGASHKKICSCIQKKLLGNSDYYIIIKLLTNKENPIILKNKRWKNTKQKESVEQKGFCQGFKLISKYDTGETRIVRINKSLSDRIIENSKSEISKSYKFLTDQFKRQKITIDPRSYEYIANFYNELKAKTNNIYTERAINNFIGRWLHYINKVNNNENWYRVSKENHRLNSILTSMPKELRKFILVNNKPLEMIDIKSSQPYILSSILKSRFFKEDKIGYNLFTTYNDMFNKIKNSDKESNNQYHNNSIISDKSPYKISKTRSSLYMWCEFLTEKESQSVMEYGLYEFKNDFYQDIIDKNIADFDEKIMINREELREKLKSVMMLVLFDSNYQNRNNNAFIKLFKKVYPGVNVLIEKIHRIIGKKEFAYIMQRTESYLMLNNVCREFNKKFDDAPIFTIHDALYTTNEYITDLQEITSNTLQNITGKTPGITHTKSNVSTFPDAPTVDARWLKLKSIDTKSKYEKIEHTILQNNIELAEDFIKNWSRI
jgi:hypothetical protein